MGSCMSYLPFHAGGGRGPKSITWTPAMAKHNSRVVNYDAREQAHKTYTSQVAESHIEALINARHKRTKKMQWTREGAHHVLQIRAMMASEEWESKGQDTVLLAL